jgi:hypothetical protein
MDMPFGLASEGLSCALEQERKRIGLHMNRRSVLSLLGIGALSGCGGGGSGNSGSGGAGHGGNAGSGGGGAGAGAGTEFDLLQIGTAPAYWIQDEVWNGAGLKRGTYTGLDGTQFETSYGRSTKLGPNGEVAWQAGWKFPTGATEVKAFLSVIFGNKPGYANSWVTPGGHKVLLPDNTYSTTQPSGPTPGSFLPVTPPAAAPGAWPDMFASFDHQYLATPTGRGQLTFDIWLQDSPTQAHGFGAPPITHEVMIPLDYWGNYGAPSDRDPGWYSHDAVIDGRLWHVYFVRNFAGGWTFVVFEPDAPLGAATLNIGAFLRHLPTRMDSSGRPWANGTESLVSIELGVEPVDGVGAFNVSNYRVWMT